MKRLSLALVLLACLLLAACGGSSHRLPAHATARQALSAAPVVAPAAIAPAQSALGSVAPAGWGQTPPGTALTLAPQATVPTGVMYDAVDVGQFPNSPFAAAGYTAGRWITWGAILRRFPLAHHISVAISAIFRGDCLDVEPGDASPAQAGPWALADIRAGFAKPCLYSDLSEMPAVRASLAASGLARSRYFLWLAWYRFIPGLVPGYDAVQWTDRALGRNLDQSTVSLPFLSIAQPPLVAPKPPAKPATVACFHRRETPKACAAARARVASDLRAVASSRRALAAVNADLAAHSCIRPYRRGVCIRDGRDAAVFAQRVRYFTAAAERVKAAN